MENRVIKKIPEMLSAVRMAFPGHLNKEPSSTQMIFNATWDSNYKENWEFSDLNDWWCSCIGVFKREDLEKEDPDRTNYYFAHICVLYCYIEYDEY